MISSVVIMWLCFSLNHDSLHYLIWNGPTAGIMPDLFETLWHAHLDIPYSDKNAIYPPLCYVIIDSFNLFLNEQLLLADMCYDKWQTIDIVSKSTQGLIVAIIYSILIFNASIIMIFKYYNGDSKEKIVLGIFFFGSAPFIYMYERGNVVIIAMLLLAVFFAWYDSNNFYKARIALLCLSVAVCLKAYPAIAGIILLSEKKYKLFFECALYTLFLFFFPFIYTGGLLTFFDMLNNIDYFRSETIIDSRNFGFGFKVSLQNSLLLICEYFRIKNIHWVSYFVNLTFLSLIFSSIILKKDEYRVLAIMLIMVLIPPFSWIYNVIYLFIPYLLLLNIEEQRFTKLDALFLILLFSSFVALPYGYVIQKLHGFNMITLSTFVSSCSLVSMAIVLQYETLRVLLSRGWRC